MFSVSLFNLSPRCFLVSPARSEGVGASLQRGSARPSAQHPSQQNPAETPPGNTFPPAHWLRGAAAKTGLSGKPRLLRPHRHCQGQGNSSVLCAKLIPLCHHGDIGFGYIIISETIQLLSSFHTLNSLWLTQLTQQADFGVLSINIAQLVNQQSENKSSSVCNTPILNISISKNPR